MRFLGLMFAVAALGLTSRADSPPPNMATGANPNVDGSWNSVTIGNLGDTEAPTCPWDCGGDDDGVVGIVDCPGAALPVGGSLTRPATSTAAAWASPTSWSCWPTGGRARKHEWSAS